MNTNTSPVTPANSGQLQLISWQEYPLIPSGEQQTIYIQATQDEQPLKGVEFSLLVELPDGTTQTYTLLPAGEDGKTSILLDPIVGPNGSIVRYEVCSIGGPSAQECISGSYIIWDQQ